MLLVSPIKIFLPLAGLVARIQGDGGFAYYCSNPHLNGGEILAANCDGSGITNNLDLSLCYANDGGQLAVSVPPLFDSQYSNALS